MNIKIQSSIIHDVLVFREMTKAVMTTQPGGTSTTINTRAQATEVDTNDEPLKVTKQTNILSDHSPFSPRRTIQKSFDRATRRSVTPAQPADKDYSTSKKQQRTPLTATHLSDLTQLVRRSNLLKTSAGESLAPNAKVIGKNDSAVSPSHSDSAKAKNTTQNRSQQLKTSDIPAVDELPSPPFHMQTSTSSMEYGKPPKTPRSTRTTTSRSDGITPMRPTVTRPGDNEALSIAAGTFAIKAGPQTVLSQWVVSLDDNLDGEESDNQHSAKWEDAQEKLQRLE